MGRQIAHAITIDQLFDMIGVRFDPENLILGRLELIGTFLTWERTMYSASKI